MSKVLFLAENLSDVEKSGALHHIHIMTNLNIVEIKERILDKTPLAEFVIDGEQHEKKVKAILQWLALAEQKKAKIKIYELNVEDDFTSMGDVSPYEIDKETLLSFI